VGAWGFFLWWRWRQAHPLTACQAQDSLHAWNMLLVQVCAVMQQAPAQCMI
jgi:hypothetical protein